MLETIILAASGIFAGTSFLILNNKIATLHSKVAAIASDVIRLDQSAKARFQFEHGGDFRDIGATVENPVAIIERLKDSTDGKPVMFLNANEEIEFAAPGDVIRGTILDGLFEPGLITREEIMERLKFRDGAGE
jgi:hypothetical protein